MKPHRQIRKSSRVGDPSSKYAYDRSLDDDFQDKQEIIQGAKDEIFTHLDNLIKSNIQYSDGGTMSQKQKWDCIIESLKRIKTQYNL